MRGHERARHAGGLAQRAHVDDALGRDAAVREAAAAFAQHAEAVRIVDDEPGVVRVGQREQARERRDIAVHAEHRIGGDELAPRGRGREARRQRVRVAMRIAHERRPREQRAVVQARVIELVGEDRVVAAGERRQDREVGEIARRERERPRARAGRDERGQFALRASSCGAAWPHTRCDAPAPTPHCADGRRRRRDQRRVVRESEVVVAGEREQRRPVDAHARALRAVEHAPRARQPGLRPRLPGRRRAPRCGAWPRGSRARGDGSGASRAASNSARSASTSGLPVVSRRSP